MKSTRMLVACREFSKNVVVVLASVAFVAPCVLAQNPGSPVVADAGGAPGAYSNAYIDASASTLSTGNDFCVTLNKALLQLSVPGNYPAGAGVVDARGVLPTTTNPKTFTCS